MSVPQASADLSQYRLMAPGNVEYDRSGKTYLASTRFNPVFGVPTADSYLSRLGKGIALEDGTSRVGRRGQDIVVLPELKRRVDADTLRKVVRAIPRADEDQGPIPVYVEREAGQPVDVTPRVGFRWAALACARLLRNTRGVP